jgi:crotonobetainyl-CoA:carnitine CoA-transferase CaiB-like acyl-CoA transferase
MSLFTSSYPAAIQILAALRHKEKTGKGAVIGTCISLPSGTLASCAIAALSHLCRYLLSLLLFFL